MEFREQQLENGLEVIAECNPHARSTAIGFFVSAGARDESDENSGISHFLEHMAFKGTPRRSPDDVNRELDEMGSSSNARTSEEQTIYHATVLPDYQDRMVELLSDLMRPSLREEDFEAEKKVIIEEILMYEDSPPFCAPEKCMAEFFDSHPLARNIIGSVESVGQMTPARMRAYFEKRYSPGNIKLVATGAVDFDRLVAVARENCGAWQPFKVERDTPRAMPRSGFKVIKKESAAQEYVIQISAGPAAADDDRFAARILSTILGDSGGSRLFWELVDPGLAEYAEIGSYEFEGTGIFIAFLCCGPDEAAENLQRLRDLQRNVQADGVTAEELSRAKNKITSQIVLQSERSAARLFPVGSGWLQRRRYLSVPEIISAYQSLQLQDVNAILEKYPLTINTTLAVGPLDDVPRPA